MSGVSTLSTGAVGFRLAPRLNAGGRLAEASKAVELLTTDSSERARELAEELNQENRARQAIENEIRTDAFEQIERDPDFDSKRTIVLASDDWHPGVIGIVASRLVERHYRPSVLIAVNAETGVGRGSCRGISAVHLYEALQQCADLLEGFGGHRMAAGLSIRADNIAAFAERFEAVVRRSTRAEDFVSRTEVDDELALADVGQRLIDDLDLLEPFGPGNREPVFISRGVTVVSRRVVGETHLRLYLQQDRARLSAIAFGMAESPVEAGDVVDVLGVPERDEWSGGYSLRLKQLRRARPETSDRPDGDEETT